jgi:hypothetical protein
MDVLSSSDVSVGAPSGVRTSVRRLGNMRTDRWWLEPLITVGVLGAFVVYATFGAFWPRYYWIDPYISPMYSPCIAKSCAHLTFGRFAIQFWTISPALLILPMPLFFRLTCYYYRKAYYRAFWWSPPACAVADARDRYTGERRPPLILQNLHRYALYLAAPYPVILLWEALHSFRFPNGWGVGLGTLILLFNAFSLGVYTLSCHSCRHLCGGYLDQFSLKPARYKFWKAVTWLNERHMPIAWASMIVVAFADVYVRLVAAGAIPDPRIVF